MYEGIYMTDIINGLVFTILYFFTVPYLLAILIDKFILNHNLDMDLTYSKLYTGCVLISSVIYFNIYDFIFP